MITKNSFCRSFEDAFDGTKGRIDGPSTVYILCRILMILILVILLNPIFSSAALRYWVGNASADWHQSANWSNTSGGNSGYSVPGGGDIAIFDASGNDCVVTQNVVVKGLTLANQFAGTVLVVPGISLTVNSSGYNQAGGEFSSKVGNFHINGPFNITTGVFNLYRLDQNGGGDVNSPEPTLTMDFEDPTEPSQLPSRPIDHSGSGNGCLSGNTAWNQYYSKAVCVASNRPLSDFAIERSDDYARVGSHSLRFYLKPSPLSNWPSGEATHRAELGPKSSSPIDFYSTEGDETWHGMSYLFPQDFIFAPSAIENNIRFIITQWQHGSPGSPIIALEVLGDQIVLKRHGGASNNIHWYDPVPVANIEKGQWMDLVIRVKWSKTNGLVQIWTDGQLIYDEDNIQTIYSNLNVGGALKMGIYYWRWKQMQSVQNTINAGISNREIFIDEYRYFKGVEGFNVVNPSTYD